HREVDAMSASRFRVRGALADVAPELPAVFDRATSSDAAVRARTAEIIARVRQEGDAALRALAAELDGVTLAAIEVDRQCLADALDRLDPALRAALERAQRNIATAHAAFVPQP